MRTFDAFLSEQLQDPEFRAEYEALEPEFAIISAIIEARKNSGLQYTSEDLTPTSEDLPPRLMLCFERKL